MKRERGELGEASEERRGMRRVEIEVKRKGREKEIERKIEGK